MHYILDTNTCIFAIKQDADVIKHMQAQSPADIAVTAMTVAELYFGAVKSKTSRKTREAVDTFLEPFDVFNFDTAAAEHYATVRATLEKQGTPIGERDLIIASIALANHCAVVTNNTSEFKRVPALTVLDWRS